jgi:hypothetical protein
LLHQPWNETIADAICRAASSGKPNEQEFRLSISENDVFKLLNYAADHVRNDFDDRLKIYINGRREYIWRSFLPSTNDGNIEDFENRVGFHQSTQYLIYASGFDWINFGLSELRNTAGKISTQVFKETIDHIDLEVFIGRYSSTPGGIHREACHNFHIVLSGAKAISVWSPASLESSRGFRTRISGELFIPKSYSPPQPLVTLQGHAGLMLYWPSNYWHVGTSQQGAVSLNIAVYPKTDGHSDMSGHILSHQ